MILLSKGAKLTLGIPTLEDIKIIAAEIRDSDRKDMEGLHPGSQIEDIILHDVRHSKVVYGLYMDGEIRGALGVIPLNTTGTGTPWVVGTSDVDKSPVPFVRASRKILNMLQNSFPVLDTWVCAQNSKSINWHHWCGFTFDKEKVRIGRDEYYRAARSAVMKINKEII
ncbi:hypothetical protein [Maridesulfovibrio zosterae]|uniref:hypothetical protein n=1 Tax=Maridesulfovibrio zosterae TaxID=82171 RepID=UPI00041596A6|nr:hypothetical protein [Maridesulfovibrio zosterae]